MVPRLHRCENLKSSWNLSIVIFYNAPSCKLVARYNVPEECAASFNRIKLFLCPHLHYFFCDPAVYPAFYYFEGKSVLWAEIIMSIENAAR